MARRSAAGRSPKTPAPGADGGPGSARARLRLGAAVLVGLLAVAYLVLAIRVYFFPGDQAVASAIAGVIFLVGALVYGVLLSAVVKQSRVGHIVAAVVCVLGAVLSINVAMAWPDWVILGVNLVAFGLLLGCVPRKASRS